MKVHAQSDPVILPSATFARIPGLFCGLTLTCPMRSLSSANILRRLSGRDRRWLRGTPRRRSSTPSASRGAASSSRARRCGGCTATPSQALTSEEPILIPDGERFKQLADRRTHLRRADPRGRRSRDDDRRRRRRRHRRHRRLRRRDLPARHPGRPGADDAAGAGRQRDRRQGRRQPRRSART